MDEVSFEQLLLGIKDDSYKDQRAVLTQYLINKLADSEGLVPAECRSDFFHTVLNLCSLETNLAVIDLLVMLLANATIPQACVEELLKLTSVDGSCKNDFHKCIKKFLEYNTQTEGVKMGDECNDEVWANLDPWRYIGSVLCNLCQVEDGRRILLNKSDGYMDQLTKQVRSANPIRRRGAVGSIRSCLFDKDVHWWMVHEVKALNHLMIPLIVATPFTDKEKEGMDPLYWLQAENPEKKYDSEADILKLELDCVLLLCQQRPMRETLRRMKLYPILRNLDLVLENNEEAANVLYEVVNFLVGDEGASSEAAVGGAAGSTGVDAKAEVEVRARVQEEIDSGSRCVKDSEKAPEGS